MDSIQQSVLKHRAIRHQHYPLNHHHTIYKKKILLLSFHLPSPCEGNMLDRFLFPFLFCLWLFYTESSHLLEQGKEQTVLNPLKTPVRTGKHRRIRKKIITLYRNIENNNTLTSNALHILTFSMSDKSLSDENRL